MDNPRTATGPVPVRSASGLPTAPRFTLRQREVLDLVCEGLADKAISKRMRISLGTVKAHVGGILKKLGVSSRLQAVVSTCR
jgi:DNA-binding NarL/FixJ family response regulator